ncbi:MAG TPA: amidophosphoribosyltransferase [Acidobacteriota bacterium]|jgi:amidophosphoribosyltransferase|nr:amidophosphoribosyltransferase [Acidobacteriota bacterium]
MYSKPEIIIAPDKFHDHCGIFGITNHPEAARNVYLGLYALQHRGQESAGIVSSDGKRLHVEKGMGYVADVFDERKLSRLTGHHATGHVRYSTAGASFLLNAQPILTDGWRGPIAISHNGNLLNAAELRFQLEKEGAVFQTTSDTEVILHLIARSRKETFEEALMEALLTVRGAYSLLVQTPTKIFAIRDPQGFRPLTIGKLEDSWVFSSETCALDLIGAELVRDVECGEVVKWEANRKELESSRVPQPAKPAQCIFEHVYFSRPDSVVFGKGVNSTRYQMGRILAQEAPVEADIVVPVPDSGVTAAIGFADQSSVPFKFGLIRNHYVGRTFIEPKQAIRHFGVKIKLNTVAEILRNRRVVLIDDSIVRGTTSQKIVEMVRKAGAREVHVRISSPPTVSPCYFGIDTPTKKELIASTHSVEEIRRFLHADSLYFLSLEGLKRAVGDGHNFCTACFSEEYPLPVGAERSQLDLFRKET